MSDVAHGPLVLKLKSASLTEFHGINNGAEEVVYPSIYFVRGLFVIKFKGGGSSISFKDTLCK